MLLLLWYRFIERRAMNKVLHAVVIAIVLCLATPSKAQTYAFGGPSDPASLILTFGDGSSATVDAAAQGWWSPTETNFNGNTNIVTGSLFGVQWNDFFVFDLTGRTGTVVAASIGLNTGVVAGTPSVALWDVSTSLATLQHLDTAPSAGIYADLGSGTAYSDTFALTAGHADIAIALNSDAIAAIESALGGRFAIGGSANTDIPEPSSILLLLPMVAAMGYLRRQASKRSALS
jgi:hypothetical protein